MKPLKNYTANATVVNGEYSIKTSYLSWEFNGHEEWSQGEHMIALVDGVESIVNEVYDENMNVEYVVIAPIN